MALGEMDSGSSLPNQEGRRPVSRRDVVRGAAALTGFLGMFGAGGCAGGQAGESVPAVGAKEVTLRWTTWGNQSSPMVEASTKGAALFTQKFPKIKVVNEPDPGAEKLFAEIVAGTAADVMGQCCATLPTWAQKGVLVDLEKYIKRDWKASQIKDFHDLQYNYFLSKDAGRFAVPMYMGTSALYYNKTAFQRKGVAFPDETWDWNKWRDAMTRLTSVRDEQWGSYLRLSRGSRQFIINSNGGNIVDPKDNTKAAFDQKAALDAFQWIRDRMWQDNVAINRPQEQGSNAVMLARGRVAMMIEGSFVLTTVMRETAADATDWDVALLPKGPVERRNRATVDGWVMWKEAKNKEEAWALLTFLQTDEWWDINMPLTAQQPTRISLQGKYVEVLKRANPALANKNLSVFGHAVINKYSAPQENFRQDDDAAKIYEKAWTDAVIDNKAPVVDTFKQAAQEINTLLKQLATK